jgi:large subunit ribosomal protein L22
VPGGDEVPGVKTNERPGTRAVLRHYRMSASKARQVLDLIRDEEVGRAAEILRTTPREAAGVVAKVLASAVANAVHNEGLDAEDLYVAACFADEGATLKRWRPRARGRATRIRKRTCHITVIVSRLPDDRLARRRAEREIAGSQRSRRVAESRRRADLAGRLSRRRHAQEEAAAARAKAEAQEAETEQELVEDAATEQAAEDIVEAAAEQAVPASEAPAPAAEAPGDAIAEAPGDAIAEAGEDQATEMGEDQATEAGEDDGDEEKDG